MKKLILIVVTILASTFAFSAPVIKLSNPVGIWRLANNWDLNRLPVSGDTIIIPVGKIAVVDINFNAPSTVFFLKVYGTLLIDGPGSKMILGTGSSIIVYSTGMVQGTGSPSEIIKIGDNTVFKGNETFVTGPSIANASTSGFDPYSETALPVKFVGLTLTRKSSDVLIQWSTTEEINANVYELEKSFDGANWNPIAFIAAIGNSTDVNNYAYTDKAVSAKVVYYRIKQIDLDGKFTYTAIRSIKNDAMQESNVNIAAVQGKVLLQISKESKSDLTVRFISLSGQVIDQQIVKSNLGQVVLNSKVAGNYVISVSNGQDINTAKQVIL